MEIVPADLGCRSYQKAAMTAAAGSFCGNRWCQPLMPSNVKKTIQIFWRFIYRFESLEGDAGSSKQTIPPSIGATTVKSPRSRLVFIAKDYLFVKLKIAFRGASSFGG
jgi:hypothetical protein